MTPIATLSLPSKITPAHVQRLAYIYVRQSSLKQVAQNKESQQYQYQLQQRAIELGWAADRMRVIDSDLGRSGSEASARTGFQELVAEVSLGHAGIVFGYEVSRLARNNQDWYHLLDLSAVFGTIVRSCVMRSKAIPRRFCKSLSSFKICASTMIVSC